MDNFTIMTPGRMAAILQGFDTFIEKFPDEIVELYCEQINGNRIAIAVQPNKKADNGKTWPYEFIYYFNDSPESVGYFTADNISEPDTPGAIGLAETWMEYQITAMEDEAFREDFCIRLVTDCKYYCGFANRDPKVLWAGDAKTQLEYIQAATETFEGGKAFREAYPELKERMLGSEGNESVEDSRTKKEKQTILDYLEKAYCGAKLMDDEDLKIRLSRAIAAFEADVNKPILMACSEEEENDGD